jgi:hypothetical protein
VYCQNEPQPSTWSHAHVACLVLAERRGRRLPELAQPPLQAGGPAALERQARTVLSSTPSPWTRSSVGANGASPPSACRQRPHEASNASTQRSEECVPIVSPRSFGFAYRTGSLGQSGQAKRFNES